MLGHDFDEDVEDSGFIDRFNELFEFSLIHMANIYDKFRKEKGDSWQDMDVDLLRAIFIDEVEEFMGTADNSLFEYYELIDIVLMGLMLVERLSEKHSRREGVGMSG